MAQRMSIFLELALLLLFGVHLTRSECNFEEVNMCLDEKLSDLENDEYISNLCLDGTGFYQIVDQCLDIALIQHECNQQQLADIQAKREQVFDAYTVKCETLTTTTTTVPPPECGSAEGWQLVDRQISRCVDVYSSLSQYQYSLQLTKYGVCKNTQDMIDCLLGNATLNPCVAYKESFYRELIPRIKFAHLFDCELTIEGSRVYQFNADSECDIWEWLACHNDLLEVLPNVDQVGEGYNLNQILDLSASDITRELATNQTGCSQYESVSWFNIKKCRDDLAEKCKLLEEPNRDSLWSGVLDVMYELTTKLIDKLYTLMNIEEICADGCDNLMYRIGQIETTCKNWTGLTAPDDVIEKFNNGPDVSAACSKLSTFKTCLTDEVIDSCQFLNQSVVFNLHLDNKWKLAFDICQTDHDIKSDGHCANQGFTENKILAECSFQGNSDQRIGLLKREYNESIFCGYLQLATNCYQQNVAQCSALEREYWAAELPLMSAANQMIADCDVNLYAYNQMKIKPINADTCDWNQWVGCLSDLWNALGVNYPKNVLSLDGFKSLLEIVWDEGSQEDIANRCQKVNYLNFYKMEQCVSNISCQYPMLTFPDGEDHKLALRNPFDVTQLKEHVTEVCKPACSEQDITKRFQYCLDIQKDQGLLTTYPKDIIASGYRQIYEETKCNKLKLAKECVDYFLNPNTCTLFKSSVFKTKAVTEAIEVCDKLDVPSTSDTSGAATVPAVCTLLLTAIFYSTFA